MGDEMDRGGEDAGRRATDSMGRELDKGSDRARRSGDKAGSAYGGAFEKRVRDSASRAERALGDSAPRMRQALRDIGSTDITPRLDSNKVMRDMRQMTEE